MSLNIVLDIDQTMYHLDVIDHVSKLLGLNYKTEDVLHWVYDKQEVNGFPKHFTDLVFAHFDNAEYMGNLTLYDGVIENVKRWKNEGHNLYVITARQPSVYIATINMLNRDFGVGFFKSIHFVEHKTDAKLVLYKELGIDVTIDDNPIDIYKSCKLGLQVFAINNKYTKYNTEKVNYCIHNYYNCTKINSLGEIYL